MNRKGFTLIEIITTITILGIISVVAIPMVNKYLLQSRDKTYDTYVTTLYNATREYFSKNSVFLPDANSSKTVYAKELLNDGYIDDLVDPENKNQTCDYDNSFVRVENVTTTTDDGKVRNNAKFKYYVTLNCHNKKIEDNKLMN